MNSNTSSRIVAEPPRQSSAGIAAIRAVVGAGIVALLLGACTEPPPPELISAEDFPAVLRDAIENARPGDVINVPVGKFSFDRSLVLTADGVMIRGMGIDKSILSFTNQVAGAEGLLVTGDDFTLADLAIEDTIGDALKMSGGTNMVVRRVRTEWTNGPDTDNGAYGMYPVGVTNLAIELSTAIGASDAGIYVGQSRHVVLRYNHVEYNVAGIEVENTVGADVYENVATNNTAGILVFNMPDIAQRGHSTRVFNNIIEDNNTDNFAAPGTTVSGVPRGTGILINSNDRVEVFRNHIRNHGTANIIVSSYFSSSFADQKEVADSFDPWPEDIFIFDNPFGPSGDQPGLPYLEEIRVALFGEDGTLPDIIWDGHVNPARDVAMPICVLNVASQLSAQMLDIDAANQFVGAKLVPEQSCSLERLTPIQIDLLL